MGKVGAQFRNGNGGVEFSYQLRDLRAAGTRRLGAAQGAGHPAMRLVLTARFPPASTTHQFSGGSGVVIVKSP